MTAERKMIPVRPTDEELVIIQKLAEREKRSISNLLIYLAAKEYDKPLKKVGTDNFYKVVPKMVEALKGAVKIMQQLEVHPDHIERINSLLAKAELETQPRIRGGKGKSQ